MMKSKNKKIQEILTKGIAIALVGMFSMTPIAFATSSLDDSAIEPTILNKILYGEVGGTARKIEEWFSTDGHTTLYISNEIQLRALAEYVNYGNSCSGKVIKLQNDIYLNSNEEWVPIGKNDSAFSGTFEGNNNTIYGMRINDCDSDAMIGFFGYVSGGTIKNVRLSNAQIIVQENQSKVGLIAGTLTNAGKIINCKVLSENNSFIKNAYSKVGGIVGTLEGGSTVEKCVNAAGIYSDRVDSTTYIGGIVGVSTNNNTNSASITKCLNIGKIDITNQNYVGGILGGDEGGKNTKKTIIDNCTNSAKIKAEEAYDVGGIAGYIEGKVNNCVNTGEISGKQTVGGIVGLLVGDTNNLGQIINCRNEGNVNLKTYQGGGIVGVAYQSSIIQKCYNTGVIIDDISIFNNENGHVGGIVGWATGTAPYKAMNRPVVIDACINNSNYIQGTIAGGIVGLGNGLIINNCINYNTRFISTDNDLNLGGIAGNLYVDGSVTTDKWVLRNNWYLLSDEAYKVMDDISGQTVVGLYVDENMENETAMYQNADINAVRVILGMGYGCKSLNCNVFTRQYYDEHGNDGKLYPNGYMEFDGHKVWWSHTPVDENHLNILGTDLRDFKLLNLEKINNAYNDNFSNVDNLNTNYFDISDDRTVFTYDSSNKIIVIDKGPTTLTENAFDSQTADVKTVTSILDSTRGTTVTYEVQYQKAGENTWKDIDLENNTYLGIGDKVKVIATFSNKLYKGTFNGTSLSTENLTNPTIKINNKFNMTVEPNENEDGKKYTGTYTVTNDSNNESLTDVNLLLSDENIYTASSSVIGTEYDKYIVRTKGNSTNISKVNIYIDTQAPIVNTKVYVENALETGRYTAGKEVLIKVTTSEPIKDEYELPEIQVSFSESGVGKYNYDTTTETVGYAKCKDAKINVDGTTTWSYSYQIQEGDEGDLQLEYKEGEITDLAGNETDINALYTPQNPTETTVSGTSWNNELGVTYEFYKNSTSEENKITANTYFTKDDDLIAVATFDKVLYVHYGLSDGKNTNVRLTNSYKDSAPSLYLNGNSNLKNDESPSVTIQTNSTVITYTFDIKSFNISELINVNKLVLKNENIPETVSINGTTAATNGLIPFAEEWYSTYKDEDKDKYKIISNNAINTTNDITHIILDPIGVSNKIEQDNIYADTTAPTVQITAQKLNGTTPSDIVNNITNADVIRYTFTWSEELAKEEGRKFEDSDITVNNGTKGTLSEANKNDDGTYSYTMDVTTNVEKGNVGDIQVIVEQNACQDLVGHSNVRTESVIRVDKKAPILIGLEAYATSDVTLGNSINDVKENYKTGDTVTIVATFDENIESTTTVPNLALQFSESGNAKGTVSTGTISGNKITYTYTITSGDEGTLSVKGFTGEVVDVAGNITKVTKRNLDGDTIIADSEAPKIVGITAIAPNFEYNQFVNEKDTEYLNGETKRYGVGKQIKFLVEFNEEIYHLDNNKKVEEIVSETAPTLKIKFGTGTTRDAVFTKIDGKVLEYTYIIQSGDNGNLSLVSMIGAISDIAGNNTTDHKLTELVKYEGEISKENEVDNVIADTTAPTVNLKVTQIENDGLTGTENHYKAGNILTITATTNEYIYSKTDNNTLSKITSENIPSLGIKFGEENAKGDIECTNVEYSYNENTKETNTIFTYEYTITAGDNGEISLSFGENKYYDIALNGNSIGTKDSSSKTVIADTIAPYTSIQYDATDGTKIVDNGNGTYTAYFNEKLYYLDGVNVRELRISDKAPMLVLDGVKYEPNVISSNGKEITYEAEKGIEINGIASYNNICDIAGNILNTQISMAPTLLNIKITKPEDKTGSYSAGTEVTFVAKFSKRVTGTAPTLKIKFGDNGTERIINSETIDKDTITYKYTIQEGDNGNLSIVSLLGEELRGEDGTLYEGQDSIALTGDTITADTTKPTVIIKAYTDYQDSSKKTEVTGKTNSDLVTYEFTWSEKVENFDKEDITVINGIKDTFTKVNDRVYTLDVINCNDGVQTVTVSSGVCTDTAKIGKYNEEKQEYVIENKGNPNESARINSVEIDRTAPTVRFITPNGGNYTTSTDSRTTENQSGTALLKARIEINEDVSIFKYRVVETGETAPEYKTVSVDQINSSDIDIIINNATVGEYVVEVIAVDKAGNEKQAKSNKYVVVANTITLTPNVTTATNQDVTVTVSYGEALTENRKAGIQGKTQSADSTIVIIAENGTVYAEATDIAGNKVYAVLEINNIDKTAPKATISYTTNDDGSVTATIRLDDENATITNNDGENTYTFTENGEFIFEFVDGVGNKGTATAKVTSINKAEPTEPETPTDEKPIITDVNLNNKQAIISTNITDSVKYAITSNNTTPSSSEWQDTNAITVDTDGRYYAWAKKGEEISNSREFVVDTEGPIISEVTYANGKITIKTKDLGTEVKYVGISNSTTTVPKDWTEVESTKDNNGLQTGMVTITANGDYYIWAKDKTGNVNRYNNTNGGKITVTGFGGTTSLEVIDYSVIATPDQSEKYILVEPNTTGDKLKEKINVINGTIDKLSIEGLVTENRLKTGAIVKYDTEKKYTIVVKGDVNGDGKVNLLDIIKANSIRINETENKLEKAKLLAIDLNRTERVEIRDIMSINRIRINSYN